MWYAILYDLHGLTILCVMWSCDGLLVWFHICWLLFHGLMWYMKLSTWCVFLFHNTYMSKYVTCSLTQLRTCGQVLSDITPHASTLLSGPGYQDGGRSVWDTLMIERRSLMYYVAVWYRDLKTLIPNTCYLWVWEEVRIRLWVHL